MSDPAWAILSIAAAFAVVDWIAVSRRGASPALEYVAKPATTAALIALAAAVDAVDPIRRDWFLAALVLCLIGDVFLMLPGGAFVPGLGSFLLAHVAYIIGLSYLLSSPLWLAVTAPMVDVVAVILGIRLVGA